MPPPTNERRGAIFILLSALSFSVMTALVKRAGKDLPVEMLVLARASVTLVLSAAWLRVRRTPPWGNNKRGLVTRALLGVGGLATYFYAVTALPMAEATVLYHTNPIFTALLASVLLGERADLRLAGAMALSLAGTILVARPAFLFGVDAAHAASVPVYNGLGVAAGIGSALFSAGAYSTVRKLAATDHPDVIVFYFALIATPLTIPMAVIRWVEPTPTGWLLLLGIGVATQGGQVFMTRGLAQMTAGRATTLGYVQLLFATGWGWLLFRETPTLHTLIGGLLVLVSVVLLMMRRPAKQPSIEGTSKRSPADTPSLHLGLSASAPPPPTPPVEE